VNEELKALLNITCNLEDSVQNVRDFKTVKKALKRNKPLKMGERNKCPNCNTTLNMFEKANYCMHCGQRLDWSDR
jgi:uncharacterized protein (DUF983 family)